MTRLRLEKLRLDEMKADYIEVLSAPAGRRVFGGIFYRLGLRAPLFDANPHNMAYKAGIHDALLRIHEAVCDAGLEFPGMCEAEWKKFEERHKLADEKEDDEDD